MTTTGSRVARPARLDDLSTTGTVVGPCSPAGADTRLSVLFDGEAILTPIRVKALRDPDTMLPLTGAFS